jgi:hypothetical protein
MAKRLFFNEKEIIVNQTWAGIVGSYMEDIPFRNHIMNGAIFEQDMIIGMLEPYIKWSRYICDIGAHCGHHTLAYSNLNENTKIYSFEPQEYMFKMLQLNIFNNLPQTKNVTAYNFALGDVHGVKHMQRDTFGGSAFIGDGGQKINMVTLDSLNINGCDFMKIDVEGYEPLVLEGARETIKKYRPVICFEDNGSSKINGITDLDVHKMLSELEYVIHPLVYDNFLALPLVKSGFRNGSGAN